MLNGGMHDDFSLNPAYVEKCNLLQVIAADTCLQSSVNMASLVTLMVLSAINQSFTLMVCFSLWGKLGSHSSGSLHRILFMTFSWAEYAWMIGSSKPSWPNIVQVAVNTSYLSVDLCNQDFSGRSVIVNLTYDLVMKINENKSKTFEKCAHCLII